jgi:hypothetical protein
MKRCMKNWLPENVGVTIMPSSITDVTPVATIFFILLNIENLLPSSLVSLSATGLYVS